MILNGTESLVRAIIHRVQNLSQEFMAICVREMSYSEERDAC